MPDNGKLAAHYQLLMDQLAYGRLAKTSLSQPGRSLVSEKEHHTMLELIIAKDGIARRSAYAATRAGRPCQ